MEKANVSKTATIEQLFEDYKARYYEETPRTEEQTAAMSELEELTNSSKGIAPAWAGGEGFTGIRPVYQSNGSEPELFRGR